MPLSPPAKRKRRQLLSCDTCRYRRVRCIRDSANVPCEGCNSKGIVCTSNFLNQRKAPQRTGPRIETAKSIFGTHYELTTNPTTTTEDSLASVELSNSVAAHFIKLYFDFVHSRLPLLDSASFLRNFERANHKVTLLPPDHKLICNSIFAIAARFSDHPFVVGMGAPSLSDKRKFYGKDMREWAEKRLPICHKLDQKAREAFCTTMDMDHSTISSIIIVNMYNHVLEEQHLLKSNMSEYRLFHAASCEQAIIYQDNPAEPVAYPGFEPMQIPEDFMGGRLFWLCYLRDSFMSVYWGSHPCLKKKDIIRFAPDALSNDLPQIFRNTNDLETVKIDVIAFFSHLGKAGRFVSKHITGPYARSLSTIDFNHIREFWADTDFHIDLCRRATSIGLTAHQIVDTWILHSRLSCAMMIVAVHNEIERRHKLFPSDIGLRMIFKESIERMFHLGCILAGEANTRNGDFGACLSSMARIFEKLIYIMMDEPHCFSKDTYGQFKWNLKSKVYTIMSYVDSFGLQSYSFAGVIPIMDRVKSRLFALDSAVLMIVEERSRQIEKLLSRGISGESLAAALSSCMTTSSTPSTTSTSSSPPDLNLSFVPEPSPPTSSDERSIMRCENSEPKKTPLISSSSAYNTLSSSTNNSAGSSILNNLFTTNSTPEHEMGVYSNDHGFPKSSLTISTLYNDACDLPNNENGNKTNNSNHNPKNCTNNNNNNSFLDSNHLTNPALHSSSTSSMISSYTATVSDSFPTFSNISSTDSKSTNTNDMNSALLFFQQPQQPQLNLSKVELSPLPFSPSYHPQASSSGDKTSTQIDNQRCQVHGQNEQSLYFNNNFDNVSTSSNSTFPVPQTPHIPRWTTTDVNEMKTWSNISLNDLNM